MPLRRIERDTRHARNPRGYFAQTGNAELAFVALSQVINRSEGGRWLVPQTLYKPILQDAVLLKTGEANDAARAFMAFLKGSGARALIQRQGYETQGAR